MKIEKSLRACWNRVGKQNQVKIGGLGGIRPDFHIWDDTFDIPVTNLFWYSLLLGQPEQL